MKCGSLLTGTTVLPVVAAWLAGNNSTQLPIVLLLAALASTESLPTLRLQGRWGEHRGARCFVWSLLPFISLLLVCSTIMYSTYCTVVPTAVCSAPDVTSFSLLPVSSNHCVVERSWALFVFRCLLFCSSLSRYCCVDESTEMQVHYPITTTFSKECCDVPHGWLVVVIAVVEGWRGACTGNLTVVAGMMQHPAPPRRLDDGDEQQQQSPVPTIGRRPLVPLLLDGGGTVTDFCREDGLVQAKQVLSGITEHIFIVRVESS